MTRAVILFGLFCCAPARAQEAAPPIPGEVVTAPVKVQAARAPVAATALERAADEAQERALDEPGFVTVVPLAARGPEAAPAAEVLSETVGVRVRSLGGLGAFASLSMRGAPPGQTEIFIDGVPLSRLATAALDLSMFDLDAFERVDVHRGGVPVELGGAVLGGAVNFVSAVGRRAAAGRTWVATMGAGSFGARHLRVTRNDVLARGRMDVTLSLGYRGAAGDYRYFDDGGTTLVASDDRDVARENNHFDQLDLAGRTRMRAGIPLDLGIRVTWKEQGVPGLARNQARHTTLTSSRGIVDLSMTSPPIASGAVRFGVKGYQLFEGQRFRDPDGEVGLGAQDRHYSTMGGGATLWASWLATSWQLARVAVDGRIEGVTETDELEMDPELAVSSGGRSGVGLALSDELALGAGDELVVIPAVRIDYLSTTGDGAGSMIAQDAVPEDRSETELTPRVGARWRVVSWLTVKANVGKYYRPPTLVELFGDRGFLVGSPRLRAETGTAGDVGLVAAPAAWGPFDRLFVEVATFASRPHDLIALLPNAGRYAQAQNVGDARLGGHEVAGSARLWRRVTVTANYTFLDAVTERSEQVSYQGKRLPGRPRHDVYVRADVPARAFGADLGAYADLELASASYYDAGNLDAAPGRVFVGAGVSASWRSRVTLVLEGKNLGGERVEWIDLGREIRPGVSRVPRAVADVLGYPLPGRSFYATLELGF